MSPEELQKKEEVQADLDRVIRVMKAQHQYINNLQQANLTLKSKVKSLEELRNRQSQTQETEFSGPDSPREVPTQADLLEDSGEEDEQEIEMMEMVPIGTIEDQTRREMQARRAEHAASQRYVHPQELNYHYKQNFCQHQ